MDAVERALSPSGQAAMSASPAPNLVRPADPLPGSSQAVLVLSGDIAHVPPGSDARAELERSVIQDIAIALGCGPDRLRIRALTPGSIVVHLDILPPPPGSHLEQSADDLAAALVAQVPAIGPCSMCDNIV